MSVYEYRVIPAPDRVKPSRGESAGEALAAAMQALLTEMSAQGWEFVSRDRATAEVRRGWFGRVDQVQETLLTFRREARVSAPLAVSRALGDEAREPRLGAAFAD